MPTLLGENEASALGGEELIQRNKIWSTQETRTRVYWVLADNTSQNETNILATAGIPSYLTQVAGSDAFCKKREAKEVATVGAHPVTGVRTILWSVACEFSSEVDIEDGANSVAPQSKPPKVRWYGELEEEPLEQDAVSGDPVVTAAGESIEISGPVATIILEVRRYELAPFDPDTALAYGNRVNSEPFYGAPVGTAWLQPLQVSEKQVVQGIEVVEVIYLVKFKIRENEGSDSGSSGWLSNTWDAQPLHEGTKFFPAVGKPAEVYTDKNGNRSSVRLAADGTRLSDSENPVFLRFARIPRANLNDLNLGPF